MFIIVLVHFSEEDEACVDVNHNNISNNNKSSSGILIQLTKKKQKNRILCSFIQSSLKYSNE